MRMEILLTHVGFNKSDYDDETWSHNKAEKDWQNNGQTLVPIPHGPCP